MRLQTEVCLTILLVVCLGQTALTQCHAAQESGLVAPATPTAEQRELEDHTVLLRLTLSKRGAVRDATVMKGPTTLREAAIAAVRKHNYKHQMNVWPVLDQIDVEVIFSQDNRPQDNHSSAEIRQVLPAGIPSCIYATSVRITPDVMQSRLLKRVEPVFPTEMQPVEGTVILRVRVDKDGNVFKAEKISGPDILAAPVIDAVKGWKYEPTVINGSPMEVETTVELKLPR
jgi:hypothetical protein